MSNRQGGPFWACLGFDLPSSDIDFLAHQRAEGFWGAGGGESCLLFRAGGALLPTGPVDTWLHPQHKKGCCDRSIMP